MRHPAIYSAADGASNRSQRSYLWVVRLEFLLLFALASISSFRNSISYSTQISVLMLITLGALFMTRVFLRQDEKWYQSRALAESVKTATWRFAMRANPFGDSESVETPKTRFRDFLAGIIRDNKHLGQVLRSDNVSAEQITQEMLELRRLPPVERLDYYVNNRVMEQQDWYAKKSASNARLHRIWLVAVFAIYLVAAATLVGSETVEPALQRVFDPLLVAVTGVLGWLQIKRHGELTASYNLTAHEIGLILCQTDSVQDEQSFSEFVNEAELAFSREHTQWSARRETG